MLASNIPAEAAIGKHLLGVFPQLDTALFHRNFRSVLSFGNTAFFSHSANPWLIPLAPAPGSAPGFDKMQQSGQLGPLRENDTIQFVYLIIRDITETVTDVQHLTRMAMHDSLTGAWNRRSFERSADLEMNRAHRYHYPLSIMMIDIDYFKKVNDQYGHTVGDTVLNELVDLYEIQVQNLEQIATAVSQLTQSVTDLAGSAVQASEQTHAGQASMLPCIPLMIEIFLA